MFCGLCTEDKFIIYATRPALDWAKIAANDPRTIYEILIGGVKPASARLCICS